MAAKRFDSGFYPSGEWRVFDPSLEEVIGKVVDEHTLFAGADVVKRDGQRFSCVVCLGDGKYFCKLYQPNSWISRFKGLVYGCRVAALRNRLLILDNNGVPANRLVAARYTSLLGNPSAFIMVYEWLEGGRTAHTFFSDFEGDCEAMAVRLTDNIVKLHQLGYCHGDLKLNNIVVVNNIPYFVDVEHIRKVWRTEKKLVDFSRFIAGLIEVGTGDDELKLVLSRYAKGMKLKKKMVYPRVRAYTNKIISRHNEKYGKGCRTMPDYCNGGVE